MSYTGSVIFNGVEIFQEGKSGNSDYCMQYPINYMRSKPCLLDIESINRAYKKIREDTGYGYTLHKISTALNVIRTLTSLMEDYDDEVFDENGNLIAVVKMQNSDCDGNSQDINFYMQDRVSNVTSVEYNQRISITEEEMKDIRTKRLCFVNTMDLNVSFDYNRNKISKMLDDLKNIKNINDVYILIGVMQDIYIGNGEEYKISYKTAMKISRLLEGIKEDIADGISVHVRYKNNRLYFINGDTFESTDVEVDDFSIVSELFKNNGINTPCGVELEINNRKMLKEFMASFPDNKYRSALNFESMFFDIYHNKTTDNESFSLVIRGGY